MIKQIPGFSAYLINTDGEVFSLWERGVRHQMYIGASPKKMRSRISPNGHVLINLYKYEDGIKKMYTRQISRLVLETFIGPCPEGNEACHDPDRDLKNNKLTNLRWDIHHNNIQDKNKHGTMVRGEAHYRAKLTTNDIVRIRELAMEGVSGRELAVRYGVAPPTISMIISRKKWTHA